MVQERRQKRRFSMVDLELRLTETDEVLGRVVNLSEGGMLATVATEFEKEAILSLRIPFDKPIEGEIFFDFQAEVVWCMPDVSEDYSIGLQFAGHSDLQYMFLQRLIHLYSKTAE